MKIIEIRKKSVFLQVEDPEEFCTVIRFIRSNWGYLRMKEQFPERLLEGIVNVPLGKAVQACAAQNKDLDIGTSLNVLTWW